MRPSDQKPPALPDGRYASIAARILMTLLSAARMARPDVLRPIIALARHMHAWTVAHDKAFVVLREG